MKRKIKLFTVLLAVTLVAGLGFFWACQKEEVKKPIGNNDASEITEKNYEAYVEELMSSTNIDIYALSRLEKVQKEADKQRDMMNMAAITAQSKGNLTEEKLIQIQNLEEAIKAAFEEGDDYEVLRLYESLCAICMTIDGFIFDVNEYGLQTFTYDIDRAILQLPIDYMEAERLDAIALMAEIETNYPSFPRLPHSVKTEILAAAITVNILHGMTAKGLSVADCEKEARTQYAISMGVATAGYEASLIGCAFSGIAAPGCIALASSIYAATAAVTTWQYKRALNRCK